MHENNRRVVYAAEAYVTGGRAEGRGRTSDGVLEVDLRTPNAIEGSRGTNPEQLFAIACAACLATALGVVGRRYRQELGDIAINSRVMLMPTAEGAFRLAVGLVVSLPSVDNPEVARQLVTEADRVCSYSNAMRGNVGVWITVNGRPIEERSEPLVARAAG